MKLPNIGLAVVAEEKVVDYLLSDAHRDGRHKAMFFKRFGFTIQAWEGLASALREHAVEHDITRVEVSPYGHRYVIEGSIRSPDGRHPFIRSIWFIEAGEDNAPLRDGLSSRETRQ